MKTCPVGRLAALVAACFCAMPLGGGIATGAEPAAARGAELDPGAAAVERGVRVYACPAAGVPTYSDRPCAPAAEALEIRGTAGAGTRTAVPATAVRVPGSASTRHAAPRALRQPTGGRAEPSRVQGDAPNGVLGAPAAESARCRSVRASLARLQSRMRAGYASAEGEKLRARRRELRAAQHAERCRPAPGPP